jgi:hypothetical protein
MLARFLEESMSIVVIMPVYNAAKTLKVTYESIPQDCVDKIILPDVMSRYHWAEIEQYNPSSGEV